MSKKILLSTLAVVLAFNVFPQAGSAIYSFLDLPVSSRQAALGGSNVSLRDNDLNFAFVNPALLTSQTGNTMGVNYANYLADIAFGSAMYSYNIDSLNYLAVGVQYTDYGQFDGRDDVDAPTGYFTAKDMSLSLIYARALSRNFTVGATLKPVSSVYEMYTSYGIAADLGLSYADLAHGVSAGLVFRNMGRQIKGYYTDEDGQHWEALPFNIMLGFSKKLAHAPFRFSLTLNNLQRWDLSYLSENQNDSSDDTAEDNSNPDFVDMAFRHAVIGVEFVPGKNFYVAASYNHRRHSELSMTGFKSSTGFSFGAGLKLYKFQVGFGVTPFQTGIYAYQFSISTSLKEFGL